MSYYYMKFACFAALAATFTACVTQCQSTGMHMLGACLIGLFWQQVAFVGHDIGHNSITHNRATDYMLGAVNVAIMVSAAAAAAPRKIDDSDDTDTDALELLALREASRTIQICSGSRGLL